MKPQFITPLALMALAILPAHGAITIPTLSAGDGFYHNELGSGNDFYNDTAASVSIQYYFDGFSTSVQQNTGYAQFALSTVPPATNLASAYLNIYLESSYYLDESTSAGYINHVANSSGANGSASQQLGGTQQVVEIKDQALGWLQLDVTALIQADLDNGYSYSAFSFNYNTAGYFRNSGFSVTSADAASNGMYLTLNPIPEPSTATLLLGSLLLFRRRRA